MNTRAKDNLIVKRTEARETAGRTGTSKHEPGILFILNKQYISSHQRVFFWTFSRYTLLHVYPQQMKPNDETYCRLALAFEPG